MKKRNRAKGTLRFCRSFAIVLVLFMVCTMTVGCGSKVYSSAITLTAPSAEKIYDGSPLLPGEAEVKGLPEGYTAEVTVSGSQTDAGNSKSTVEQYVILNAKGKDKTKKFKDVSLAEGSLTVKPAEVTITTADASKIYDGTPLTAEEVEVTGFVEDDVVVTAMGSQLNAGSSENTYTIDWGSAKPENYTITEHLGTLTVEPAQVTITTESAAKPYDGTELTASAEISGAVEEGVTVTATGSQLEQGSSENGYEIDWGDADPNNYVITEVLGTLTVGHPVNNSASANAPAGSSGSAENGAAGANGQAGGEAADAANGGNGAGGTENQAGGEAAGAAEAEGQNPEAAEPVALTITTSSASKPYDGTELTAGLEVSGSLEVGITIIATGSQLGVGSSENGYEIDWGDADPANYEITENLGTLTVEPARVTITTASASKPYDGTELTAGVEVSGLLEEGVTVTATGIQLGVGSSENGYIIDWGDADPANYEITENLGTLTVEPARVTITTGSATKPYDGTELTAGAEAEGFAEAEITVTTTGSQTNAGSSENSYTIDWGDADPANFEITEQLGTLTVEPAPVLIRTGSAWKTYDAQVLTSEYASITGVMEEGVTVTATGSQLNAGESVNGYEIDWGQADPANYAVTEELGSLTVDRCPLTIITHSATKRFDGTPLTRRKATIICPIETDIWAGGTGAQTYVGSCYNSVAYDWGTQDPDNFDLHVVYGQLTVKPAK